MRVYRYTVEGKGFLTALDDYFKVEELLPICWVFELKLPRPAINMSDTCSYFTERGNKTFHKAIKKVREAYAQKGIKLECIMADIDGEDILYRDKYQVIMLRSCGLGSS